MKRDLEDIQFFVSRSFATILLLFLTVPGTAQRKHYTGISESVYGNVKSITLEDSVVDGSYFAIVCETSSGPDLDSTVPVYDVKGNELSCAHYGTSSVITDQWVNQYDTANNRICSYFKDNNGKYLLKYFYKYDAKGYPSQTIHSYCSDATDVLNITDTLNLVMRYSLGKSKYCYSREGMRTEIIHYREDGSIGPTYGYEMNVLDIDPYKQPEIKVDERYDVKGHIAERKVYYLIAHNVTDTDNYDDSNTKKTHIKEHTWVREYLLQDVMVYDSTGQETEHKNYYNGVTLQWREHSSYDARGNILHKVSYDKNNSIRIETFYRYEEFDEHGNWHKRISWQWIDLGNKLNRPIVSYRDIEYYE